MIDFPHSEEGSRKLMNRAAVVALILLVGAWFAFSWFQRSKELLATPSTGSDVHTPATNADNAVPAQSQSTSIAAKQNPGGGEAAKQNPVAPEMVKQNAGGEEVAKQNPAGGETAKQNSRIEEHASGGHPSAIKTSKPINIDDAQRATLRAIFATGHPPTVERPTDSAGGSAA
jgi:hypothetical protein